MTPPDSDGFDALPPSAKYVHHVLVEDGPLLRQELQDQTGLPTRTLDRALDTLQNGDYITVTRDNGDLRQVVANVASSHTL